MSKLRLWRSPDFSFQDWRDAREISKRAQILIKERMFGSAERILREAISRWPKDIFFYAQLLMCLNNPDDVWEVLNDMKKNGVRLNSFVCVGLIGKFGKWRKPEVSWDIFKHMVDSGIKMNSAAYVSLFNSFYVSGLQQDIVERIDPYDIPIDVVPNYCESLRKIGEYEKCIELCDYVISLFSGGQTREHALIVRFYCFLHTDRDRFLKEAASLNIDQSSPHHPRFLAALVFGKACDPPEMEWIRKKLIEYASQGRNPASMWDIKNALAMLSEAIE